MAAVATRLITISSLMSRARGSTRSTSSTGRPVEFRTISPGTFTWQCTLVYTGVNLDPGQQPCEVAKYPNIR
jgi:hypothetical protein